MHRALAHPTCLSNPPGIPSDIHVGTDILQKSHANLSSKVQLSMDVKLHLHVPSRMNREQDVHTCVLVVCLHMLLQMAQCQNQVTKLPKVLVQ